MEKQEKNKEQAKGHDNSIGGAQTNKPDPEATNDTGFAGTTNAVSEDLHEQDGYKMAVEDTMIGYDGHEEQMDMDYLDEKDKLKSGNSGADDNS
ncbi:hypothetical protein [Desertivirga xinjiangensis]|uniref:hypothetical protein n=1 Tax=Desertivirga xinjiangensis TaxID=539206 RepID=UPI00210EFC58|nr:hypothetical protein [Pedobacter xinjiangensis]